MGAWLEITLTTTAAGLEGLAARLTGRGVTGLVIEDEVDFQTFLAENRQYWDYVDDDLLASMKGAARIKFYEPDDEDGRARVGELTAGLDAQISVATLREEDWANSWKRFYKPMEIGARLYVVPQWEVGQTPAGRTPLVLNPGLIFGTGSHASTQLCLEGVEERVRPGDRVLDLGCGSGILSIAALCLGGQYAMGVDIDDKAVDVAYENAALNGIGRDRYLVRAGDVLTDRGLQTEVGGEKYQLILANIVADVIIPLARQAVDWLAPGGLFLCSGIIDTRGDDVAAALQRAGMTILEKKERKGWVAFVASLGDGT